MELANITALSPIDGRYANKVDSLRPLMSEYGLIRYRLQVEVEWLLFLSKQQFSELPALDDDASKKLQTIYQDFSITEAEKVKAIESKTNHDVKAVEYYLRDQINQDPKLKHLSPFIHFACTSEDINNLSYALMVKDALAEIIIPMAIEIKNRLQQLASHYSALPMLARTHGQPASPTTLGKEMANFVMRLRYEITDLEANSIYGKFNGAVGNFNAHLAAYPDHDWPQLSQQFIRSLGLKYHSHTTQIEPHDHLARILQTISRINTILIDLDRDIWSYISIGYFTQKQVEHEVGSSTMPHKVNPIDFENSEGNLGLANALANHMAGKLPVSRWQRDLTDSTVLRNLGSVFAYSVIAYQSSLKGLSKLEANEQRIRDDLDSHWEVLAEAVQTVMRRYGIEDAYEQLKAFTRGKVITEHMLQEFITQLGIPEDSKQRLLDMRPADYIGTAAILAGM